MVDLPEPDRPVNQRTAGFWLFSSARACLLTSSACQWMLAARRSGEVDHAGADRGIGEAVDQDESAGGAVVAIGIEGDRRLGGDVADADLVHVERLGRLVGEIVDVDLVLERR